jgi:DNA replicative helicase MCM subunit Mcm2 (Cdc46/Mcm family)
MSENNKSPEFIADLNISLLAGQFREIFAEAGLTALQHQNKVFNFYLGRKRDDNSLSFIEAMPDLAAQLLDNFEDTAKYIAIILSRCSDDTITYTPRFFPYDSFEYSNANSFKDIDKKKMHRIKGQITSISKMMARTTHIKFMCKKCGAEQWVVQLTKNQLPSVCPCGNLKQWREIDRQMENFFTFQFIESSEIIKGDERPQTITCEYILSRAKNDTLSNSLHGKMVDIIGVPKAKDDYQIYLAVNNVIPINDVFLTQSDIEKIKEFVGKNKDFVMLFARHICRNTYKYDVVKKALLLTCIGLKFQPNQVNLFHLLIVGDFGVAKTRLAKAFLPFLPRMRVLSGTGISYVGAVGGVEKNPLFNTFEIKTGALVNCHDSTLFLDETDKASDETLDGLHTGMSDGIVTIDKAGIHADFKIHTNIVALANPVDSKFNPETKLYAQIDIPSTLLDRFGLIAFLRQTDFKTEEDKDNIFSYIAGKNKDIISGLDDSFVQKAIYFIRQTNNPELPDDIFEAAKQYLKKVREKYGEELSYRQKANFIRFLLIHARANLRDKVTFDDLQAVGDIFEQLQWTPMYSTIGSVLDVAFEERISVSEKTKFPKAEKEKWQFVLNLIERGVALEFMQIIKATSEVGMTESETNNMLERLGRDGRIMENPRGTFRFLG